MIWTPEDELAFYEQLKAHYEESRAYSLKIGFPVDWLAAPIPPTPWRVYCNAPIPKRGRRLNPEHIRGHGKRNYWR